MDVWVVSDMTANEGGYVVGVAASPDAAKAMAGDGAELPWEETVAGSEWSAAANSVSYWSVQRFKVGA